MSSSPKLYVDSCCFIELVKFQRGIPLAELSGDARTRENECWYLRRLCDAARAGTLHITTSMLTVAECTHVGEDGAPTDETQKLFVDFLTSGAVVHLVEPDIFVAEQARDFYWKHDIKLKGADALHVATAHLEGCTEFMTLDERMSKRLLKEAIPKLKRIGLQVTLPHQTSLLPIEYRQATIDQEIGPRDG